MRRWLDAQLGPLFGVGDGVAIALDPEHVLSEADLLEIPKDIDVLRVSDWAHLRRAWDLELRPRGDHARALVIVQGADFQDARDLPWDIEHEASAIARVRWPVPASLRALFRVAGDHAGLLAEAALRADSVAEVVAHAYDIHPGGPEDELAAIARIRLVLGTPGELWDALRGVFTTQLARSIAAGRGDLTILQEAWNEWLRLGRAAPLASVLARAPGPLMALLGAGLLGPAVRTAGDLPHWVALGTVAPDPDEFLRQLLAAEPAAPQGLLDWFGVAAWWGRVRACIAARPSPPRGAEAAWAAWSRIDEMFGTWLRHAYGSSLLSSAETPRALHQVAPFLARRVDEGARVLLVVVDGMGFSQWNQVRTVASLRVLQETGCLAMIPTLTTVSRQATFAGKLPLEFADTIATTGAEARRWAEFWAGHRIDKREATFYKVLGSDPAEVPAVTGRAVAVVINAIDDMLHGAEVLGDRQVAVSVDLWARAGFLKALVSSATCAGYEVWITSDHGNLQTIPGPVPREGQTVEAAGTRVRLYPNAVLRGEAASYGIAWDPPGYPLSATRPLFAAGRAGFHVAGTLVSHGGLSLDEVIVPFVQVTT